MVKTMMNSALLQVVASMVEDVCLNCELVERLKRKQNYNLKDLSSMSLGEQNLARLQTLQDRIQINKVERFIAEELNQKLDVVIQSVFE
jgi:pantothenate kinase